MRTESGQIDIGLFSDRPSPFISRVISKFTKICRDELEFGSKNFFEVGG
jgi:hypothetical protein